MQHLHSQKHKPMYAHTNTHTKTQAWNTCSLPPGYPGLLSVWSDVTAYLEPLKVWWDFSRQSGESAGVANHQSSQDSWIREGSLPRCSAPKTSCEVCGGKPIHGLALRGAAKEEERGKWERRKTKAAETAIFLRPNLFQVALGKGNTLIW